MGANYFDYFLESCDEELLKTFEISEAAKEGVFKDNYVLRDNLQNKFIHDKLLEDINKEKIIEFTGKFIDDHTYQLSTTGPVHIFTFGEKETKFFYDLFNINETIIFDLFNRVNQETYYGNISKFFCGWIENAPHKLLITAILIDALQNNYSDIVECCEYIWAFCEYPIIYRDFWEFGVKEDVMAYTMEHLGAKYKFIQKKMKSLQELLKYHANISVSSESSKLKTGADNTYFDFMQRMRNQIKNSFKNISREYYNNYKNNKTLHQKDSTFEDGKIAEQEGHATNMSQIIYNTISKFIISSMIPPLVKTAAEASQVDKSILTGYLNQIFSTKGNKVNDYIESIITAYFMKYPSNANLIKSEFITFGLVLYRSLGSSKDKIYSTIKEILNMWMNDIIKIKDNYSSPGTIINYTRAIFNYMIFVIAYYN